MHSVAISFIYVQVSLLGRVSSAWLLLEPTGNDILLSLSV